jgi:hypothetical protein
MKPFSFLGLLREQRSGLLPMLIAQKSLNEILVNGEKFLLILAESNSYL